MDSLNLSYEVGDNTRCVDANWQRLTTTLGELSIVRMDQVHGTTIRNVTKRDSAAEITSVGEADGIATRCRGIGLAVMTADCVPILLVAPTERAVMALHAGWRGTVGGIAAAGLAQASAAYGISADQWEVAIGPGIGGCCYEVDTEIGNRLERTWGAMADAWHPATTKGKGHLFLDRANANILIGHGVAREKIRFVGSCTACNTEKYFSHRKSGGSTGRQVSIVGFAASA